MTNVLLEKKGHIAVATINRPKALNALNSQVLEDIDQLVEQVKADSERDHWMIAEEAREYGLVDKVIYKR